MSKLMLIDVDWIEKEIAMTEEFLKSCEYTEEDELKHWTSLAVLHALKAAKDQLQSPADLIRESFLAGREKMQFSPKQKTWKWADEEQYLKQQGYE